MSSDSPLTDYTTLPCTVPMLDIDGNNWLIFKRKFEVYMDGARPDKHFSEDGILAEKYDHAKPKLIKEDGESDDEF